MTRGGGGWRSGAAEGKARNQPPACVLGIKEAIYQDFFSTQVSHRMTVGILRPYQAKAG